MIYAKVIKYEGSKIIIEDLNMDRYRGGRDEIVLARFDIGIEEEVPLTQKDINRLYWEKKAEYVKQAEEKRTKEESEQQKELAELRAWKAEMTGKNFVQQIFTLWNMRKCQ